MLVAKISPSHLSGKVTAPPSKSMAHRLIICAALANGKSEIKNVAFSEDIKATISCMRELGSKIDANGDTLNIEYGTSKKEKTLFVNESGSTLRFLIPLCLTGEKITLTGKPRLFERPLGIYEDICKVQGIKFTKGENSVTVEGKLSSGNFEIAGDISSQFISGLLFALPMLDGDSEIKIVGSFESKSYVLMTIYAMEKFGVKVDFDGNNVIKIKGNQKYQPCSGAVEGDFSNAAFFEALNYIGHNVEVLGLSYDTLQGDSVYKKYFEKIKEGKAVLSLADCPDLAPVMFTVAAYLKGAHFTETKRLRLKESDRAAVMREELAKFGAQLEVSEDEVIVKNKALQKSTQPLSSHNDHRIAMSLALLCTIFGGEITDAGAVKKSMPDFYEKLILLGAEVDLYEA